MNEQIAGHCGNCGAPYYTPTVWHGVVAPAPRPSCTCWNTPQTTTSTKITVQGTSKVSDGGIERVLAAESFPESAGLSELTEAIERTKAAIAVIEAVDAELAAVQGGDNPQSVSLVLSAIPLLAAALATLQRLKPVSQFDIDFARASGEPDPTLYALTDTEGSNDE